MPNSNESSNVSVALVYVPITEAPSILVLAFVALVLAVPSFKEYVLSKDFSIFSKSPFKEFICSSVLTIFFAIFSSTLLDKLYLITFSFAEFKGLIATSVAYTLLAILFCNKYNLLQKG